MVRLVPIILWAFATAAFTGCGMNPLLALAAGFVATVLICVALFLWVINGLDA